MPFVLFGVFRYLLLIHRDNLGAEPERVLLRDKQLLGAVVLWGDHRCGNPRGLLSTRNRSAGRQVSREEIPMSTCGRDSGAYSPFW